MDPIANPLSVEDSQKQNNNNNNDTENPDISMEENNQVDNQTAEEYQNEEDQQQPQLTDTTSAPTDNDTQENESSTEQQEESNDVSNDTGAEKNASAGDQASEQDLTTQPVSEDHLMTDHDGSAENDAIEATGGEDEDSEMQNEQFHDAQEKVHDDTQMNVDETTHEGDESQQEERNDNSSKQEETRNEPMEQDNATTTQSTPAPTTTTTTPPSTTTTATSLPASNSFISAPASWQIPPSALQPKTDNNMQGMKSTGIPINNTVQQQTSAVGYGSGGGGIMGGGNNSNSNMGMMVEPVNKAHLKRERLEQRIEKSVYDTTAWLALINEVQQTGDLEATREVYERFLQEFPTSPRQWLAYLELELKYSNFNEVEALFTRCLKTVLSVDLWKFYLGYIRRINQGDSGTVATPEARAIIEKAYEYVLNNVGIDKDAGPIWADYIYFLKSAETTNTWEEQRKMDSMRRAYQKAVAIPLNNVEHLWKEYDQWENNLNRLTAKKFLGEKSSAYMTARTALREMRTLMENVNRGVVPKPPQWTDKEISQLAAWKQYIEWEKSNPLQLEDESMITERVAYAYQQAFLVLRFYPELWYDYAMYYIEHQKSEKALGILKQGVEVLPSSLLLTFAYTELCESKRQLDDARQAFDVLLEHLDKDIEKIKDAAQQEMDKIQQEADEEKNNMNLNDDIDGEIREQLRVRERQVKKDQEEVETKMNEQVDGLAKGCSLVWINYMRFARRTEGIKAARALFSRARKAANRTYHVFIASALMEYHNSKDATIAGKIFGLGLKQFADDPDYISYYLDYLVQMNDDNNTRALFERTLATMPATKAEPIWAKFLDYENKYGDLASIHSVEKRRHEALPDIGITQSFMERYTYLNIHVIDELELGTEARERKSGDGKDAMAQAATSGAGTSGPASANQANTEQQRGGRSKDQNAKRPLLEPVHPERYPRPDLNQWQSFKPAESSRRSTGTAAANVTSGVTSGASAPSAPNISGGPSGRIPPNADSANPPPPMAPPTISQTKDSAMSSVATPSQVMNNIPGPQQVQQQQPLPSQQQQQQPPTNNWNTNKQLPEPVAYFVSNLPPAHNFNGPLIQANELAELLRNVIIPLPQGGGPSMRGPQQQQQQQQKPMGAGPSMGAGGRDMPPNRGGYGRGGGRGGFKSRGGGPGRGGRQGVKRRGGRDDFEDDYQQHNKGMGPNRPPAYDVFRARQAKRHRDDPTY